LFQWVRGERHGSMAELLYRTSRQKKWSELWHIKVPSKVPMFSWRLAKQSLLMNDVRYRRRISAKDIFQLCGTQDSWWHRLLDCSIARCVWALADEEMRGGRGSGWQRWPWSTSDYYDIC
jgi:hypothetical protein